MLVSDYPFNKELLLGKTVRYVLYTRGCHLQAHYKIVGIDGDRVDLEDPVTGTVYHGYPFPNLLRILR